MISFYIALISPLTVIVDRYSIVARKTDYACGNSVHLFIEFLFESQASLNKRAVMAEKPCFGKIEGVAGIHAVRGH